MRRRRNVGLTMLDELESRLVLSHASFRAPSVLVSGLTPRAQALGKHQPQPVVALVNKAFDSFVQDYTQARAAYLSSDSSDASVKTAFTSYTTYRVELLAQQITSSGLQSPLSNSKQKGQTPSLQGLVLRRIGGPGGDFQAGTLGKALTSTIPDVNGPSAAAALNSLAQDQAIETARASIINGFHIIKNGDFGNRSSQH